MFISGLSLFLAIICVMFLIFTVIQIAKAPAGEEGQKFLEDEGNEGGAREKKARKITQKPAGQLQ